ncbi:MAG: alpha/beta hydrolase [Myxococcota bacterium]|nr:alpha/beta hydrolase [Myxococcota bacterium]
MQPRSENFRSQRAGAPELHFLSWGDTALPKLVLLHGGGSNAHWWDHLAPSFANDFHVIALDFRGHGASEYPEQLVVGAFNEDVELLLEHLGCRDVVFVGHSMGCHIAVDHASRHPGTRGLALIDIARGSTRNARRRSRLALRMRGSYARREDAIDRFQFLPETAHADESLRVAIAEHSIVKTEDDRYTYAFDPRWFTIGSKPPPDLTKVECPVLILRGAQSAILTDEGARDLTAGLSNARIEVVEDAGHHVHIDQPEATLGHLLPFLKQFA